MRARGLQVDVVSGEYCITARISPVGDPMNGPKKVLLARS
jgi:hypothetical protein